MMPTTSSLRSGESFSHQEGSALTGAGAGWFFGARGAWPLPFFGLMILPLGLADFFKKGPNGLISGMGG
jgi:uncharacterized membrane protein